MCLTGAATSGMIWRMGRGSDDDASPGGDRDAGLGSEEHTGWDHLARLIRERRAELGLTQREVHSVGGPSPATQTSTVLDRWTTRRRCGSVAVLMRACSMVRVTHRGRGRYHRRP